MEGSSSWPSQGLVRSHRRAVSMLDSSAAYRSARTQPAALPSKSLPYGQGPRQSARGVSGAPGVPGVPGVPTPPLVSPPQQPPTQRYQQLPGPSTPRISRERTPDVSPSRPEQWYCDCWSGGEADKHYQHPHHQHPHQHPHQHQHQHNQVSRLTVDSATQHTSGHSKMDKQLEQARAYMQSMQRR